jgi:ferredoxin--NADP+ reductase/benzoate/toluate 1,2-dioxygenase reductase subunit
MAENLFLEIQEMRQLTTSSYILRFGRNNIQFRAGQHIGLGFKDYPYMRDYSIYSGETDNFIEVLIKEVQDGDLSIKFKQCSVGDQLRYDGPFGSFVLNQPISEKKHVFVATGTGIAPFHSFVKSYPGLNYKILHGVKYSEEAYDKDHYDSDRYVLCTSKDSKGHFKGRVSDFFRKNAVNKDDLFYLCGNGGMVYEVYDILQEKGVSIDQIFLEVYF